MNQLLPIIRRVRRPLLPVDAVPDVPPAPLVVVAKEAASETPLPPVVTKVVTKSSDDKADPELDA